MKRIYYLAKSRPALEAVNKTVRREMREQLGYLLIPTVKYQDGDIVVKNYKEKLLLWKPWTFTKTAKPILLSEELERFLRRHSIYTRFLKNIHRAVKRSKVNTTYPIRANSIIFGGFMWASSIEGTKYWEKWHKLFSERF